MDTVVPLEFPSGLDTLPGGGDLDKNTLLLDANGLVQGDQLLGLSGMRGYPSNNERKPFTYLRLGSLLIEGKASVNFSGNTARDKGEDLLAELDELEGPLGYRIVN